MPYVKFLGLLRAAAGTAGETVPAATVEEVLITVARKHTALGQLLFPTLDHRLSDDVRVLVNGRDIAHLSGLATPLASDDAVTLFHHGARGFPGG